MDLYRLSVLTKGIHGGDSHGTLSRKGSEFFPVHCRTFFIVPLLVCMHWIGSSRWAVGVVQTQDQTFFELAH